MSRSLTTAAWALLLTGAAACTPDASFTKLADPEPAAEDTGQPPAPELDTGTAPLPECPTTEGVSATSVDKDASCKAEPDMHPLQAVTEWKTSTAVFSSHPYGRGQPAIGHLTDDNGSGIFGDEGDTPDIVATFYETEETSYCGSPSSGMIRAFSGDGDGAGSPLMHWAVSNLDELDNLLQVMGVFHPAIGDIDADGEPEVIVGGWYGPEYDAIRLIALSHTGEVEWLSPIIRDLGATDDVVGEFKSAIYDLDQDGRPEVYAFGRIYDGTTGERIWDEVAERTGPMVVTDLENDGSQELITIDGIWEQDRTPRCRFEASATHLAVADLDSDGFGDVLVSRAAARGMFWLDRNCRSQGYWLEAGGRPTVADFNGDGKPDIGVWSSEATIEYYSVYEPDGTVLWQESASTRYGGGGAVVYDFDADGYAEVVYGVREPLVRSGLDGSLRLVPRVDGSGSIACGGEAFAIPVDVDGDGHVELVTHSATQLLVVGDLYDTWPDARNIWNQHVYYRTHVNDDMSIPSYAPGNWPDFNDFNSASTTPSLGQGAHQVDAAVELVNLCEVECDRDTVQVTLRMTNGGLRDAFDGLQLAVYAEDDSGSRTLVAQYSWEELLRAGFTTEGLTFRLDLTDLPNHRVVFVADDTGDGTGLIAECDEDNNELRLEELCP